MQYILWEIVKDDFLSLGYFTGSLEKLQYDSSMDPSEERLLRFAEFESYLD